MTSVRKFLFDESFDIDAPPGYDAGLPPEPEPEPEPPPPLFGEEELAATRAQGYAEGEQAGRSAGYGEGFAQGYNQGRGEGQAQGVQQAEGTQQARIAGALERIAGGIDHLIADRNATNAMRQDQPVHIALAIVRKLMPELARRGGVDEIEALVRSLLIDLIDEPRLVVRVADDTVDLVRERLDEVAGARGFGAKMMIMGDPALAPGDCRVEWAEGGAERDTARLLADIEQHAARLLTAPAG